MLLQGGETDYHIIIIIIIINVKLIITQTDLLLTIITTLHSTACSHNEGNNDVVVRFTALQQHQERLG